MDEYIIIGDMGAYKNCLLYICGTDKEEAESVLNRMLTNPTENDKRVCKEATNLRVVLVPAKECWWNDPFLVN